VTCHVAEAAFFPMTGSSSRTSLRLPTTFLVYVSFSRFLSDVSFQIRTSGCRDMSFSLSPTDLPLTRASGRAVSWLCSMTRPTAEDPLSPKLVFFFFFPSLSFGSFYFLWRPFSSPLPTRMGIAITPQTGREPLPVPPGFCEDFLVLPRQVSDHCRGYD